MYPGPDLPDAVARGNDFVLVAGTFPVSPLGILSLPGKPILKAADIVGKKILVQGPNERTAIDATLALNNLPKQWEPVPAGFSPEPLLAKAGDGYTAYGTNQAVTLEVKMNMVRGKDFHFTSFDSMGYKFYTNLVFVKREYLTANRSTVVGFLRAVTRGWIEDLKDPAVAAKLCVTKYGADLGLDLKQQTRQNERRQQRAAMAAGAPHAGPTSSRQKGGPIRKIIRAPREQPPMARKTRAIEASTRNMGRDASRRRQTVSAAGRASRNRTGNRSSGVPVIAPVHSGNGLPFVDAYRRLQGYPRRDGR